MTKSRRDFIRVSSASIAAATVVPYLAASASAAETSEDTPTHIVLSTAAEDWTPLKIIDTEKMPWEGTRFWFRKILFLDRDSGSHLMLLYVPTGWEGGANHYHLWHEWAYILSGDLTNSDYASPHQKRGSLLQFREGYYLDRPPYSLHGAEPGRLPAQMGGTLIIMEEGPPQDSRTVVESSPNYSEDYKKVDTWTTPRLIDTIGDMVWEDEGTIEGLKLKRLTDDPGRGFRVTMKWLPAGWSSELAPEFAQSYYYKKATEFRYILDGSMSLQAYKAPGEKAETFNVSKNFYVECRPNTIVGLPEGRVTDTGCVWIETTYARGTTISKKRIEEPILV